MTIASAPRFFTLLFVAFVLCLAGRQALAAEPSPYVVEIADVEKSADFAALLKAKGYQTVIPPQNIWVNNQQGNCAVWIGKKVPLEMLRAVLPEAVRYNQYIKYFHVVGDRGEIPPEKVDNTIHVGGHIESALVKKLNPIESKDLLDALGTAKTVEEFHKFLHEKNIPKQKPEEAAAKPAN